MLNGTCRLRLHPEKIIRAPSYTDAIPSAAEMHSTQAKLCLMVPRNLLCPPLLRSALLHAHKGIKPCHIYLTLSRVGILNRLQTFTRPRRWHLLNSAQAQRLCATLITNVALTQPTLLDSAIESPKNIEPISCQEDLFQPAASP